MANLSLFDVVVLLSYVGGIVLLGIWLGRGQQDARQYLLGGKNTPWWAILGSIVATETSTVTFLSVPGFSFKEGGDLRFLQLSFGYIVGRSIVVLWLLPLYFRGELFTAYELLKNRFGATTQRLASLIFIVTRNLGDGLRLYLTALVLEVTIGWSLSTSVVAIGLTTIVFTFVGGMKSVIWNDCIQLVVYVGGGFLALVLIANRSTDGFSGLLEFASETERLQLFDFSFSFENANSFWAGLIGGAFLTLGTHGTDQMMVQRSLAARSLADAGKALISSGFVVLAQFTLFLFVGIALARFYSDFPPNVPFAKSDRVFATFIVTELPKGIGLVGLLLASIFSAAMSTLSSSLNSSATALVKDWLPTSDQNNDSLIVQRTRLLTIVFGLVQIGIGIWAASFNDSVITNALTIAGFSAGLLLGLFALGTLVPHVNQFAAVSGLTGGLLTLILFRFVLTVLPEDTYWHFQIAWPWLPVIGSVSTFVIGWAAAIASDR